MVQRHEDRQQFLAQHYLSGAIVPARLVVAVAPADAEVTLEALCARWLENPYFQLFCGEEFFQHKLVFDRSSLTRWRQRMGEEKVRALLQESLAVATRTEAITPSPRVTVTLA